MYTNFIIYEYYSYFLNILRESHRHVAITSSTERIPWNRAIVVALFIKPLVHYPFLARCFCHFQYYIHSDVCNWLELLITCRERVTTSVFYMRLFTSMKWSEWFAHLPRGEFVYLQMYSRINIWYLNIRLTMNLGRERGRELDAPYCVCSTNWIHFENLRMTLLDPLNTGNCHGSVYTTIMCHNRAQHVYCQIMILLQLSVIIKWIMMLKYKLFTTIRNVVFRIFSEILETCFFSTSYIVIEIWNHVVLVYRREISKQLWLSA